MNLYPTLLNLIPIGTFWASCFLFRLLGADPPPEKDKKHRVTFRDAIFRVISLQLLQIISLSVLQPYYWFKNHDFSWSNILLGMFVMDTAEYWSHRLQHTVPMLYYLFHKEHHRIIAPWSFTALYHGYSGSTWFTVLHMSCFYLCGISWEEVTLILSVYTVLLVIDHVYAFRNTGIPRFDSDFHIIHHEVDVNSNFSAGFTTFWDHAMGTMKIKKI